MGKLTGFMEYSRKSNEKIPVKERILNFNEFYSYNTKQERIDQAARCMNCGVPFCSSAIELKGTVTGCPLHNLIHEFNDEIYNENFEHGLSRLLKTNCFPEFTGRVCPALCEKACINAIHSDAVTIHDNELFLIENGFKKGYMTPRPPLVRSDKKVAVVGSGPAGLAVAEKLNKRGHTVTVFERDDKLGGLLMYGIPNMKLDKKVIERRIDLMAQEGIVFESNTDIGKNKKLEELQKEYDAIVLCCGAKKARDISVPGRGASGIYFAVDFLKSTTSSLMENGLSGDYIDTKGQNVIVLGGGDTGNDCVGTCVRHGAKSVVQLEMMPKPPKERSETNPWPEWPKVAQTDYGQEEAIQVFGSDPRIFETTIKQIYEKDGKITGVLTVKVKFKDGALVEVENSEQKLKADILLIAAGFTGYEEYTAPKIDIPAKAQASFKTSADNIFSCGDMKRGQSLVVWAIADGIKCAKEVDEYLLNC